MRNFPWLIKIFIFQIITIKTTSKTNTLKLLLAKTWTNGFKIERERVDCNFKTSHPYKSTLSLWNGTFPREEFSMANVGSRKSECVGLTSYAWKNLEPGIDGY